MYHVLGSAEQRYPSRQRAEKETWQAIEKDSVRVREIEKEKAMRENQDRQTDKAVQG